MVYRASAIMAVLAMMALAVVALSENAIEDSAASEGVGRRNVRGRVVSVDGKGLANAELQLVSVSEGHRISTSADRQGRFAFSGIAPGRYTLKGSHEDYVSLYLGQRRPLEPVRLLTVPTEPDADTVTVILAERPGSIVGSVVDRGETLTGRSVVAVPVQPIDPDRAAIRAFRVQGRVSVFDETLKRTTPTDAEGRFRLSGLAPGEYRVVVQDVAQSDGGTSSGRRSVPIYFPGTTDIHRSTAVTVVSGEESAISITVPEISPIPVAGLVVTSSGQPAAGAVIRILKFVGGISAPLTVAVGRTAEDGSFEVSVPVECRCFLYASAGRPWARAGIQSEIELGSAWIKIDAATGVQGLRVQTERGGTIEGRVNGGAAIELSKLRIVPVAVHPESMAAHVTASAPVSADGSFVLRNVFGRVVLELGAPSDGPWLTNSLVAGRDVTDFGLELAAGQRLSDVVVNIASRSTSLAGIVKTGRRRAENAAVLLFASDEMKWRHPTDRYIRLTRAGADGRFEFDNVPHGSYLAIAQPTIAIADAFNDAVLRSFRPAATPVDLNGAELEIALDVVRYH